MSAGLNDLQRFHSREEFRRWCETQQSGRYERVDGRIVTMAPERIAHARTKGALYRALERAVRDAGAPCEALLDGVTVETGECDYEPNAIANCGTPMDGNAIAASNPVIIVEVLSPDIASTDTGGKLADYFQIKSVAHYLIVHPTRRLITHHRPTMNGIETRVIVNGDIVMDPPGIRVTTDEIYGVGTPGA